MRINLRKLGQRFFSVPKTPKQWISKILSICLILCIFGVGFFGYSTWKSMQDGNQSDAVFEKIADDNTASVHEIIVEYKEGEEKASEDALHVDWESFSDTEIVAWFQLDNISYPIMQHTDNDYYLTHLPDGSYNAGGSLFLLAENNPLLTNPNTIVYGHNMGGGQMFGSLKNYTKQDSAGKEFSLYLPDGTRHVYRFFSVKTVYQSSEAYTWAFSSMDSFVDWQNWMLKDTLVNNQASPSKDKKFVTLSTCNGYAGTTSRLIVCGEEVRVERVQKPASWYGTYLAKCKAMFGEWQKRADEVSSGVLNATNDVFHEFLSQFEREDDE